MTKEQILLLLSIIKDDDHFYKILDYISNQYKSKSKYYDDIVQSKSYLESNNNIPSSLFKYIDIDGGIASIENSNIQFSHPLSFRHENNSMGDMSEFWYEKRFYIDRISILDYIRTIEKLKKRKTSTYKAFSLYIYQFLMNTVERNKVLCLCKEKNNDYLFKETNKGKGSICIEYNTDLFKNKNNLLYKDLNFDIIYNEVSYVDTLVEYPIRFEDEEAHSWLSNFLFIKEKKYAPENEFRIIHTIEYIDDYDRSKREEKHQLVYNRLMGKNMGNIDPIRINIDRSFINHVYYTSNIDDEDNLKSVLEEYKIKYTKQ